MIIVSSRPNKDCSSQSMEFKNFCHRTRIVLPVRARTAGEVRSDEGQFDTFGAKSSRSIDNRARRNTWQAVSLTVICPLQQTRLQQADQPVDLGA
jgi:hypothetical protein